MALEDSALRARLNYYEDIGDMKRFYEVLHEHNEKDKKPKALRPGSKENYSGGNFEQRIRKSVLLNKKFQSTFKGPKIVYDFLWANIVRGRMMNDNLDIKRKYYDKGILACSYPIDVIAEKCSMSPTTVKRYIAVIEKAGFIKVEKVKIDDHRSQNVYMLGTWHYVDGVESEYLYLQDECEN